jgi:hypothetical protein
MRSSKKERQDAYMFAGFLVLCGMVVVTVVVAQNVWTIETWTAVGAIAAALQAFGVILALGYAHRQLSQSRQEREIVRHQSLLDRLMPRFSAMQDAIISLFELRTRVALNLAPEVAKLTRQARAGELVDVLAELPRDALFQSKSEITKATFETFTKVMALEETVSLLSLLDARVALMDIEREISGVSVGSIVTSLAQALPDTFHDNSSRGRCLDLMSEVRGVIWSTLEANVASRGEAVA